MAFAGTHRKAVAAAIAAMLVLTCTATSFAAGPASTSLIRVSSAMPALTPAQTCSATVRVGCESQLNGFAISGNVYVFLRKPANEVWQSVTFALNDPTFSRPIPALVQGSNYFLGTPVNCTSVPMQRAAGSAGALIHLDTKRMCTARVTGKQTLFARILVNGRTVQTSAVFALKNATAVAASPTVARTSPIPATARLVGNGGYDNGFTGWDICEAGGEVANECPGTTGRISLLPKQGPIGMNAAKFVLDANDPETAGGSRSEVRANGNGLETNSGDVRWYDFWMKFPQAIPKSQAGSYLIVMQWHPPGSTPPPLYVAVDGGNLVLTGNSNNKKYTMGPVRPGQWVRYTMHVRFGTGGAGTIAAWENGKQTVPETKHDTIDGGKNALKQGVYRGGEGQGTLTVLHAGLKAYAG